MFEIKKDKQNKNYIKNKFNKQWKIEKYNIKLFFSNSYWILLMFEINKNIIIKMVWK